MNRNERQQLFSLSAIVTQERSAVPSLQQVAGMSQPELLYSWEGEGMKWFFRESSPDAPMILTLDTFLNGDLLPPRLLNATSTVHFSMQRNQGDSYWAMMFGEPNFTSAASSGDGGICVHNDESISWATFVHELAHNLAYQLYGFVKPPRDSAFAKATIGELPPTT